MFRDLIRTSGLVALFDLDGHLLTLLYIASPYGFSPVEGGVLTNVLTKTTT
jgi:hypothetical protein